MGLSNNIKSNNKNSLQNIRLLGMTQVWQKGFNTEKLTKIYKKLGEYIENCSDMYSVPYQSYSLREKVIQTLASIQTIVILHILIKPITKLQTSIEKC